MKDYIVIALAASFLLAAVIFTPHQEKIHHYTCGTENYCHDDGEVPVDTSTLAPIFLHGEG